MIRLLLVDDDQNVRCGLRMRLGLEPDLAVIGEAGDGVTALAAAARMNPDVVVLDVRMPGLDGFGTASAMREQFPTMSVLMLSIYDSAAVRARAAECGATGFVGKHEPADALLAAIRSVASSSPGNDGPN